MNKRQCLSFVLVTACLAACTVGPDYHTPSTTMPGAFSDAVAHSPAASQPATAPGQLVDVTHWWKSFHDAELDSLVTRAVAANPDLEIAFLRLQEARTTASVVTGQSLPMGEFSGAAGWGTGTNSTKGRISAPLNAATNTTGLKEISEVVGFDAGWELDIWGKYRREIQAARADTQVAAELRNDVLISLVAEVARAYTDVRALQLRLAIARDDIQTEQQTTDLVQARFDRGLTNELDLALARRQLATVKAQVAPLAADISAAQRRIAVLLGQFPNQIARELQATQPLPALPAAIQPGLPVDLLRQRPDIRAAERQLAAATARIGVATSNLFPNVAITGGLGMQGQGLGRVPVNQSFIWSVGPAAYWPVLDFGTLDALITLQDLRTHESLVNYKRTILNAVEEVDDAINNFAAEQDRLHNLDDALVQSQRAVTLATQRYERGLTDFLNVLDAQRQYYALQDQAAQDQAAAVVQFIAVYKGLGGGWEGFAPGAPPPAPRPAVVALFARATHPDNPEGGQAAPTSAASTSSTAH